MKYEIGSRIRYFRELRRLNQKELANLIGVSNSRVSNWEQGINRPDADTLVLLCQALDVSANDLLDLHDSTPGQLSPDEQRIGRAWGRADPPIQDATERLLEPFMDAVTVVAVVFPFRVSEQAASAGNGLYLGPETFVEYMVDKSKLPRGAAFGVPISGDSMEPKYKDGDIAVISKDHPAVGQVGLFTVSGEGYIKKLGDGELLSLNPAYDPIPMNEDTITNGKVVGTLTWEDLQK